MPFIRIRLSFSMTHTAAFQPRYPYKIFDIQLHYSPATLSAETSRRRRRQVIPRIPLYGWGLGPT